MLTCNQLNRPVVVGKTTLLRQKRQ